MSDKPFNLITKHHNLNNYKRSLTYDSPRELAKKIFVALMGFRRVTETKSCHDRECQHCAAPHMPKIISAIEKKKPITFILPAFPGKSPNPEKILGPLPDQAERLSLLFLGTLCRQIKNYYAPGIKIILCSDGRVFSDVIGMKESNVTAYQLELDRLIKEMALSDISLFNLDDVYKNLHFAQMRKELMETYGQSLDVLKLKIRNGAKSSASPDELEANRMYSGITRFLFEDATHSKQIKSRSSIQKESRSKAYEVIRRSNAWSSLILKLFPDAVRLSIHPQTCGSKKFGIRLIGNESWMTPWHGVAVESKNGYFLLKRSEAEALGAQLICSSDGRHSHYRLPNEVYYEL
jgi:pyoverdine/dityrosine biosynthesis protein Dit1